MLAAIAAGKHVVTANKALLAEHGAEVFACRRGAPASTSTTRPRCAAACRSSACCARASRAIASRQLWGIVNGTSNYILSTMTETRRAVRRHPRARPRRSATPRPIRRSTSAAATPRTSSRSSSTLCFGTTIDVTTDPDRRHRHRRADRPRVRREVRLRDQAARDRARPRRARSRRASTRRSCRRTGCSPTSAARRTRSTCRATRSARRCTTARAPACCRPRCRSSATSSRSAATCSRARRRARPARPRPHEPRPLMPLADIRSRYYLRFGVARPARRARPADDDPRRARRLDRSRSSRTTRRASPVWVVVLTHEAREGDVRAALAEIDRAASSREPCARDPDRGHDEARDPRHLRRHRPDGRRLLRELPAVLRERARRVLARSAGRTRTSRPRRSRCR